jgi:hypothetical protein
LDQENEKIWTKRKLSMMGVQYLQS